MNTVYPVVYLPVPPNASISDLRPGVYDVSLDSESLLTINWVTPGLIGSNYMSRIANGACGSRSGDVVVLPDLWLN